jgi:hypothetical protein
VCAQGAGARRTRTSHPFNLPKPVDVCAFRPVPTFPVIPMAIYLGSKSREAPAAQPVQPASAAGLVLAALSSVSILRWQSQ